MKTTQQVFFGQHGLKQIKTKMNKYDDGSERVIGNFFFKVKPVRHFDSELWLSRELESLQASC